jgi:DNA-binding CsgD family transcriptional regulator
MEELYDLTSAEASILGLLVKGHTTSELSEIRNTSRETVRTQVKALLSKTRTKGRPDLVRLALTVNLPIDSQNSSCLRPDGRVHSRDPSGARS